MPHPYFIPDSELANIPIHDNGEPMVSLPEHIADVEARYSEHTQALDEETRRRIMTARLSVAEMLAAVCESLPGDLRIMLRCAYRPLALQQDLYERMEKAVREEFPEWSEEQVREETDGRVAPLSSVPPHTTGGAIDISLVDANGNELDMGSPLAVFTEYTPTKAVCPTQEAARNRQILVAACTAAGFVNYPPEWWHWSYGDRYWAAELGREYAIYGSI